MYWVSMVKPPTIESAASELGSDEQIAMCGRYNVSTLFRDPQMRSVM
jgi:hypothetical protein